MKQKHLHKKGTIKASSERLLFGTTVVLIAFYKFLTKELHEYKTSPQNQKCHSFYKVVHIEKEIPFYKSNKTTILNTDSTWK